MILRREIRPLGIVPPGYGLAYWYDHMAVGVFYPIPLNWFVSWARDAYFFLRRARPRWREALEQRCYQEGILEGEARASLRYGFMMAKNETEALRRYVDALDVAQEFLADTHLEYCTIAVGGSVPDKENCRACLAFYKIREALKV